MGIPAEPGGVTATPEPRDDVAVFAERVLRRPLWPHQVEAAESEAFITVIAAARRTGKKRYADYAPSPHEKDLLSAALRRDRPADCYPVATTAAP